MNEPPPLPETRWCSRCGATIQSAANFCHACGAAVPKSVPTSQGLANNPLGSRPKNRSPLQKLLILGFIGFVVYAVYDVASTSRRQSAEQPSASTVASKPSATAATTPEAATPEIRKAKPVLSPSLKGPDPVAEYWAHYRDLDHGPSNAEVDANLRAREAAARAKISSEAANRRGEYVALVPHKITKAWIAGIRTDKIGVDLLVESRRPTNRQLADLIRWYVGCNATVITVYDDAKNARNRESMLASYMCGDANDCTQFELFVHPGDWSIREVSFR